MTARGEGRIYNLLPAFYRTRDAELGGPLAAMLSVVEEELQGLEDDISGLYENLFIETCEEWVVPYLGDLLGVRGLHAGSTSSFSLRAHVGHTIAYRRRKGTVGVLEQLAADTTGWGARAVETFQQLAVSSHVNHPRVEHAAVLDVRRADPLIYVGGPFDTTRRTVDVRRVEPSRGRHNIPNIALWLWRLQVMEIDRASARPDATTDGLWYVGHWSGLDELPLFNRRRTETAIAQLAEPQHLPGPLHRLPLYREIEAIVAGSTASRAWFPTDGADPVFSVSYRASDEDPSWTEVPLDELAICNLELTTDAAQLRSHLRAINRTVGVDPALGRLLFRDLVNPAEVRVSVATGFPGEVGGGPYRSEERFDEVLTTPSWLAFITRSREPSQPLDAQVQWLYSSVGAALAAWNVHLDGWADALDADPANKAAAWRTEHGVDQPVGLIVFADSTTYEEAAEAALQVPVPAGCRLSFATASWSGLAEGETAQLYEGTVSAADRIERRQAVTRTMIAGGARPHLRASMGLRVVHRAVPNNSAQVRGALTLHGLHLEGALHVDADALSEITVSHCTIADRITPAVAIGSESVPASDIDVSVVRSIVRGLYVSGTGITHIDDSVVDAGGDAAAAVSVADGALGLCACTVRGTTTARTLSANDTLFTGQVTVSRRQEGCVRFSFVPPGSVTPKHFRCQPDLALGSDVHDAAQADRVATRLRPRFVSEQIGHPGYFQLSTGVAREVFTGSEEGSEMGVWCHLRQPQRLSNLKTSLATYLRFGLEAGNFFAT
jgi:hypothetical protein